MDLVFAFDTSGGLPRQQFTRTLEFAKRLVSQLNVGAVATRVGSVAFSNQIRVSLHLRGTTTLDDALKIFGKVPYRMGKRDLKQAMRSIETMFLEQNGNRAGIADVAIIITDGFSGAEWSTFEEESRSVTERGIHLFQIVWQQKGRDVVHSGEGLFAVTNEQTLMGIVEKVKQAVCDVGSS